MIRRRLAPSAGLALLLAGCNSSSATSSAVPWSDYAASVKTGIDAAAAAKDCVSLQTSFDNADANNQATMTRTGHNNAALMSYILDARTAAGCK